MLKFIYQGPCLKNYVQASKSYNRISYASQVIPRNQVCHIISIIHVVKGYGETSRE